MQDRKGDVRIYLIFGLFLACNISGGVFFCIYLVVPESESVPSYPIAGMTLVAIPWLFWFLIYLYRCFKPMDVQYEEHHNQGKGTETPKSAITTTVASPSGAESPAAGGERHVHFGAVVVISGNGKQHEAAHMDHHEDFSEKLAHN